MKKKCLHLTPLTEKYSEENKNFSHIFLGDWCHIGESLFSKDDNERRTLNYHWNDRIKLRNDYQNLDSIFEKVLEVVSETLDTTLSENHSTKYWRIILGPWLGYFIQIVFDRSESIKRQLATEKFDQVVISNIAYTSKTASRNMEEFLYSINEDEWNEYLLQSILEFEAKSNGNKISKTAYKSSSIYKSSYRNGNTLKVLIGKILFRFFNFFLLNSRFFIGQTYLKKYDERILRVKRFGAGWFSNFFPRPLSCSNCTNEDSRKSLKKILKKRLSGISPAYLPDLIALYLPLVYLEDKKINSNKAKKIIGNIGKTFFDSIGWFSNDLYKIAIAESIELGGKYFSGQHGGGYGAHLFYFLEDHQVAISDKFFSWGWSRKESKNIIPAGIFKQPEKTVKPINSGQILFVPMAIPRYSYHLYSIPISASQWKSYTLNLLNLSRQISKKTEKDIAVRLYHEDYFYDQRKIWEKSIQNIKIDNEDSFYGSLSKSSLVVCTYNSTTFLETLKINFPTLIYWDDDFWELREDAKPYYAYLIDAGILHHTVDSAFQKFKKIENNFLVWWKSKEVQAARKNFLEYYARDYEDCIRVINDSL